MDNSQLPIQPDITVSGVSKVAPHAASDSSIFSLFWNASPIIKFVMIGLIVASVWSWAVIISKHFRLKKLNSDADMFEDNFWSGVPLESLYKEIKDSAFDPISNVFCAAMVEWQRFVSKKQNTNENSAKSLEMRVDRAMQIAIRKEVDELERHMGFLSSLGTNGVIIGIFGTVLGIMGGFKVIAVQQNSSIATVAPIIAEALFTTALGLVAAIPAAIGYNKLMSDTNRYISRLETFADEFSSIISRQFDEH